MATSTNVSIDGQTNSNFTVTGAGQSLTLAAAGGGSQEVNIDSAGTGASAIDLNATAGGITLDASSGISLDGGADSNFTLSDGDLSLIADGSDNKVVIKGDHESDVAIHLDGNAAAGAIVDIDAGVLDVDAAGAITMDAGAGMSLDAGGASNFSTSAGSVTISSEANRLFLTGATGIGIQGELAGADAIVIKASNAAGGINVDSGTGGLDIDTTGALSLSGSGNSEVQVGGTLDIDARNAITIDSDAAGISLDAAGSSNFATSKGSLTLSSEANRLFLTGAQGVGLKGESADADAVAIQASDAAGGITLDAGTSGISLDATGASNFSVAGAGISLSLAASGGGSQEVDITSAGTGASAVDINATAGGVAIDAAAASNFSTSGGAITINGKTGINIQEDGTNVIVVDDTQELTLGVAGKDVIIAGDLQVQGSTTTVSSSNTTIQDSIIGLGVSGSEGFGNAGDRAIIFARSANAHDALPALNYNGTKFELAKYTASPLSASMGTAASYVDLKINSLELVGGLSLPDSAGDHSLTLEANGDNLSADRTLDFIVADSGGTDANRTLHIEANTVKLDQDYTVDADVQFNKVTANGGLVADNITIDGTEIDLSSGDLTIDVAGNIALNADGGTVTLEDDSATLFTFAANEIDVASGNLKLDVAGDILLDADGGNVTLQDGGTSYLDFVQSSGDAVVSASVHNKDVIFHGNNGTDVFRLDSSANSLFVASSKKIELGDAGESIVGDGTNLAISSSNNFTVDAAGDIVLSAAGANVKPMTNDEAALGESGTAWSDLFLASGAVINFNAGDVTATHSSNLLAIAGGNTRVDRLEIDSANDYIDVDTDLIVSSSADINLSPGGGNIIPGEDSSVTLGKAAGSSTIHSSFTSFVSSPGTSGFTSASRFVHLGTNHTQISSAQNGDTITIGSWSGTISGTPGASKTVKSGFASFIGESSLSASTSALTIAAGLSTAGLLDICVGMTITVGSFSATVASVSNTSIGLSSASGTQSEVNGGIASSLVGAGVATSSGTGSQSEINGGISSSITRSTTQVAYKMLMVDDIDINGQGRIDLDEDADTSIRASADDVIDFELGGTDVFQMTTSALLPGADNSYDLGSSSLRFRNIFTGDLNLRNDRGDWTLIEEDDFISFRNNKTGRRFRMVMEDITGMGNYGPGNDGEM